jgi:transcriptional regulator MraZ
VGHSGAVRCKVARAVAEVMDPEPNSETTTFYSSTFKHGVDEKRRVQIPAKWRPAKPVDFHLILWPKSSHGMCLRVLPQREMVRLLKEIEDMPSSDPNKLTLKRFIGSESVQVSVDKGGRICLPEDMANAADIKDQATLVGLLNQFEIWNPERYLKVKAADAVMAQEAFKMMV